MFGRWLTYLILLYGIIAYNTLYGTYDGYIMLVLALMLPLASLIITLIIKLRAQVRLLYNEETIRRGEVSNVRFEIYNPTFFPVNSATIIADVNGKRNKVQVAALARKGARGFSTGTFEHCGVYDVSVNKAYIYDYFKLFRFRIKTDSVVKVIALPRLFSCEKIFSPMEGNTGLRGIKGARMLTFPDKAGDDNSEIFDIRDYREGDRIKNIHHQLSSRMEKLMVKEYAYPDGSGLVFAIALLDKNCPNYQIINDELLDAMYSVMYELAQNKILFTALYEGAEGMTAHNVDSVATLDEYFTLLIENQYEDKKELVDIDTADKVSVVLSDAVNSMGRNMHFFASSVGEKEYSIGYDLVKNGGSMNLWVHESGYDQAINFSMDNLTVNCIPKEETR